MWDDVKSGIAYDSDRGNSADLRYVSLDQADSKYIINDPLKDF